MSDEPEQTTGAEPAPADSSAPDAPDNLDLTKKEPPTEGPRIEGQDLHKERWRGPLAGVLVGATVAIPLLAILAVICGTDANDLTDITQVLYPPLVGLVGAVIGFYFGDRRN